MVSSTSIQKANEVQPSGQSNRAAASALLKGAAEQNAGANDFSGAAMILAYCLGVAAIIFAASAGRR